MASTLHPASCETGRCADCRHFRDDPDLMESETGAFSTISFVFAHTNETDGLCSLHRRYLAGSASCSEFRARPAPSLSPVVAQTPSLR